VGLVLDVASIDGTDFREVCDIMSSFDDQDLVDNEQMNRREERGEEGNRENK
jgi:hypothetical protein